MSPDHPAVPPSPSRSWRLPSVWTGGMLGVIFITLVCAMVMAMRMRGPWYDEFYTLYVARPGIPLPYAFDRWLADNHPPLFYALVRATAWLGATVEARRVVNLFVLVGATVQIAWWLTPQGLRRIGWVFAVALAGAWPAIDRAAELRSNYLAFAAAAVAVAALVGFGRGYRAHRRVEWAMLTFALLVAFNIHLAASMVVGSLAAAMILRRLLARDLPGTARLFAAATVAALPMIVHIACSIGRIEANTRDFWIKGGFMAARWAIQTEVERNLLSNPPITILAMTGFALLAYRSWQNRRLAPAIDLAVTLAVGLVLGCVVMIAIHLWRPFIIDRYLVTLHPPMAMILALGVAALLERVRPLFAIIFAFLMSLAALTAIYVNAGRTVAQTSWYGTGRTIAAIRRSCPTTRVHVDANGNRSVMDAPPTENRYVFPFAYHIVADHFGFPLALDSDRTLSPDCPTLFWSEHVPAHAGTAQGLTAALRAQGFSIGSARLVRVGDGYVLVTRPMR
ncbi:hypothetical protein N4G62_11300 [Sphingomonas sanguinis]|uniref:Glycosyltransferase RgtA/B/C/D-like domain-containing protein n=1 Tax=Sphingomonas sanguinis TaxID=33051 RepID=A0ABU5LSB2_9SPHN|nr:hypothetical protein [Sphingomonas sanguinis]MDZ7282611.1 hypothetical protein [Sphingomonas sanguinis]